MPGPVKRVMPAALCSCLFAKPPALCAASHSGFRGRGVLNGPRAASRSIIGKEASSFGSESEGDGGGCHDGASDTSVEESAGLTSTSGGTTRPSRTSPRAVKGCAGASIESSSLSAGCEGGGGVGARRLFRRGLDFLVKIPQLLTFFFFLLLSFLVTVLGCGGKLPSSPLPSRIARS